MKLHRLFCLFTFPVLVLLSAERAPASPKMRNDTLPHTRWAAQPNGALWTHAALSALKDHGAALPRVVPKDIDEWCPGYSTASPETRRYFWVGFLSALAKHESTYRANAVGGNGRWYGLLQILPATARGYNCRAKTGAALKDGVANLSCAIRILAVTMPRDQIMAKKDSRWRGVAADWGPMRVAAKRKEMSEWLRQQSYCRRTTSIRPKLRP